MRFISHIPSHSGHTHILFEPVCPWFLFFFFPRNFPLVLSEMRGNEGWDFGPLGRDSCSPTARLPGICRRLRTRGTSGGLAHWEQEHASVCERKRAKRRKSNERKNGCEERGGRTCVCDRGERERVWEWLKERAEEEERLLARKKSKCVWGTARPSGSPRPPGVCLLGGGSSVLLAPADGHEMARNLLPELMVLKAERTSPHFHFCSFFLPLTPIIPPLLFFLPSLISHCLHFVHHISVIKTNDDAHSDNHHQLWTL